MKKILLLGGLLVLRVCFGQNNGTYSAYSQLKPLESGINYSSIYYFSSDIEIKIAAKEISQFRAKEFIINNIIGDTQGKEIKFETESLASDDTGDLVSIAYNCTERGKKDKAKELLNHIDNVRKSNEKYILKETNVNNVYIEFEDMKFIIYYEIGPKIRILWNGFEVVWEDTAFMRSKRRLNKWFE